MAHAPPSSRTAVLALTASLALAACPPSPQKTPPVVVPGCGELEAAAVPILPRTSNDELRQLLSDLVGAPIDPALFVRWTPLAQVRGFDHMTESRIDAQTLEEQLRTVEQVVAAMVASPSLMAGCPAPDDPPPLCPVYGQYDATAQFSGEQLRDCWSYLNAAGAPLSFDAVNQRWIDADPGLFIWNTGLHPGVGVDVVRRWTAPQDGAVTLRGSIADVDAGGGDGIAVQILAPIGPVFSAVIVNGGAPEAFEVPLEVRRGDVVDIIVQRGGSNAYDSTALTATFEFVPGLPAGGLAWDNCGAGVVERIASRAYRRPLRAEELADLKIVFDETVASALQSSIAAPFFEGLQASLQAALLSPNVLYKPELAPGGFDAAEQSFRRASRLSLYFRSSFPDDELWTLAASGALDGAGDDVDLLLRAQAERLLDVEADRFTDGFAGQWLNFRGLLGTPVTPLQASMRREGHDVFAAVLDDGMPATSLLAPGFTVVDGALAAHYGIAGVDPGSGPVRVDTDERGGLFTQAHFLTSTAGGSDFKRVIHRGLYALNRTLCASVPMLDPATREEIADAAGQIDPSLPLGQRMELHRNTSTRCTSCHSIMDPLGLSLEHFDDNGLWRDTYADGSAIANDYPFQDHALADPAALADFIRSSEDYRRCVGEKLLTFGLHREPQSAELCAIDKLATDDTGAPRSLHDLTVDAFLLSLHQTEQP